MPPRRRACSACARCDWRRMRRSCRRSPARPARELRPPLGRLRLVAGLGDRRSQCLIGKAVAADEHELRVEIDLDRRDPGDPLELLLHRALAVAALHAGNAIEPFFHTESSYSPVAYSTPQGYHG